MEIICTYCSASKDPAAGLIPAYKRYISSRIVHVQEIAENSGLHFCILSGEFGLVDWDMPLPWYDHLLAADEVAALSITVQHQIIEKMISKVNFYTRSLDVDPNLSSYLDLIQSSCQQTGVELIITIYSDNSSMD